VSILRKIISQTSWQILGKVITSLSTFLILGIIARNYKEVGIGTFTLALTYISIFFLITDFGFNAHVLRKFQISNVKFQIEWQKLLGIRLIWSVILMVLSLGLLLFLPFNLSFKQAAAFGSLAILGSGVFVTCNLIFQQRLRYDLSTLSSSIGTLIYLLLVLYFSQNKVPLPYLILGFMAGWVFIGTLSLLFVYPFIKKLWPVFDTRFIRNLIKDSWPIAATLVLNVVYFRADSFLIAFYRNQAEVGVYNLAYSVFQSVLVLPTFIMNAYYPLMLKSAAGMNKFLPAEVKWVGLGLLGVSSVATLATLFFSPLVIKILTGGGFSGSSESLQILSLGFPAFFLSALFMWILISKGEYKKMLAVYMSGLFFNLVLNLLYIPQYSFFAASWTTVISEYVILIMQVAVIGGILVK